MEQLKKTMETLKKTMEKLKKTMEKLKRHEPQKKIQNCKKKYQKQFCTHISPLATIGWLSEEGPAEVCPVPLARRHPGQHGKLLGSIGHMGKQW